MTLTLGLALHELATNAAKYGAFSVPEGWVEIVWAVQGAADARRLILDWTEHGGPPAAEPERRGFGRSLIERSIAYELDGSAELAFTPAGVRCRIEVPSPGRRRSDAPPSAPADRTVDSTADPAAHGLAGAARRAMFSPSGRRARERAKCTRGGIAGGQSGQGSPPA